MKKPPKKLKVALVHDFLREYGGAERVIEALHEVFPEAPVYVAFVDPQAMGIHWNRFADWNIIQSWIAALPLHRKIFSPLRIIAPAAFRSFDLSEFDVVISSSNAYFSKAVRVPKTATHICYCHTPPRSLYGYPTMTDWKKTGFVRVIGELINHVCRVMDAQSIKGVDIFVANSREVQARIKKFYRRDAVVIHPPVEVSKTFRASTRSYLLYVNRLAFAKHPELAVQAATKLNLDLKVVGDGKILPTLKEMAGETVEFLGAVGDEDLDTLYSGATALLYPVEDEDFGIVPIEAMAHGVPVIAHRSGGPLETVVDRVTGLFFDELSVAGLCAAIETAQTIPFDAKKIHAHAQKFAAEHFKQKIRDLARSARSS